IDETNQYAELETGNTSLAFASETLAKSNGVDFSANNPKNQSPGFEIGLVSNDLEHDFDFACKQGATPIKKPSKKPWGQIVGYVKDINGIIIEICSPI
ncbi:MAG: VOC family protein, partial [Legionellales bacterium]|nr:VOC family protein [Legionellales bacterium]